MSQQADDALPPHSESVEEELQRVQLALSAVFSATPHAESPQWFHHRQSADRYLTSFQATALSWMVCDRLLASDDEQTRFFAAQTLHTKCRASIAELPRDSLPSLRDSLLKHLNDACRRSPGSPVTTRLALCISALAVQMSWTLIGDLLSAQQPYPLIVLPIFRVLPEECASDRLLLEDEACRFAMRDHLVSHASQVFEYLFQQSKRDASSTKTVLSAFHTWVRYVPVYPQSFVEADLLRATVSALIAPSRRDLVEPAADVVIEILRMYPSHHFGTEALVKVMIPLLSRLPIDQALRQEDEDVLRAYCRVVVEMGESYMSWILSTEHQQASALVGWVLQCSALTNTEIASITLHFWYRMVMDLEAIEPYDWRQELIDYYTPHLLNLVNACVTSLMRYPSDIDDLPEDQIDDLNRHRFYVAETVEDCCRLLGGHVLLQRMNELFANELERVNPHQFANHWQGIESTLACISAIHRFVPSDEAELLPKCFQLIPQLPASIEPLRYTASKTIGKFASWLAMHAKLLEPLLPYLSAGLSVPLCAPAAAVAIKELCECSNQNFALAEPVLQLYQEITVQQGRQLDLADELQILEGVCRALSRQIQDTRVASTTFLQPLAQPIGVRLTAAVNDAQSSPRRILPEIERLTVIVQHLTVATPDPATPHPIVELLSSTWTLLDTATNRFPNDVMLAEKICRLHKHAMRSIGARAYAPVLDHLIRQLVTSFDRTRQSPFLYAASICITEYGSDPAYAQRLFDMVSTMAKTVFDFLKNFEGFTNHPDVVEEFFYLMGRMVSHCPDLLIKSPLLVTLLQCAVVGMRLDHHGANRGTLRFVDNTISYGLSLREQSKPENQAALERALAQEGQAIVGNLALAMMGDLPSYSNQIPEILWKLNLLCPNYLAQWLATAFEAVAALPERAKNDFMGALDTGLARDEFSLAARSFQSACERERRFRQMQRGR